MCVYVCECAQRVLAHMPRSHTHTHTHTHTRSHKYARTHLHTHTKHIETRTHTHTRMDTHTLTHIHTHTHTHEQTWKPAQKQMRAAVAYPAQRVVVLDDADTCDAGLLEDMAALLSPGSGIPYER